MEKIVLFGIVVIAVATGIFFLVGYLQKRSAHSAQQAPAPSATATSAAEQLRNDLERSARRLFEIQQRLENERGDLKKVFAECADEIGHQVDQIHALAMVYGDFFPNSRQRAEELLREAAGLGGHLKWHAENEDPQLPTTP
ncbi:MAG: hypothetical protein LBQ02_01585 [Candidatus Nomurabacteria bacterium]|jgi:hypothetical protein|nr:hypothetical protein [Candidatus Nomurabacteria bacterium]